MRIGNRSSDRAMTAVISALLMFFGAMSLDAEDANTARKVWEKTLPEAVLAVVNSDSNRITLPDAGEEPVSMVNMSVAEVGQAPFQIISPPSDILLLAARDRSKFIQLIAVDMKNGETLWQVPCTGLPVSDLPKEASSRTQRIVATFMAVRNQVIVVQQPDVGKSGSAALKVLISYDLRTGAELWRSQANQMDHGEMVRQTNPELLNKGGLTGYAVRKAMRDMNKMAPPLSSYFMLPQRGLLLKTSTDQAGFVLEAVDVDTGKSAWSLRLNSIQADYSRMMPSRAKQLTRRNDADDASSMTAQSVSNNIRGDYLFMGCPRQFAEAMQGKGQCSSLRVHSMTTGELAWEFHAGAGDVLGWLTTESVVLVKVAGKIVALKLSTGEKLYEIADDRVAFLSGAFEGRTWTDGNVVFWFDRKEKEKDRKLVAFDAVSGKPLWETPMPREKVVSVMTRAKALVVVTEGEIILLDKSSGRELVRQKPGSRIRTASLVDTKSVVVLGDQQIARYQVEPWKEDYQVTIPQPRSSVGGDLLVGVLAGVILTMPTYQLGSTPGSFVRTPYFLTPGGAALEYQLLSAQSTESSQKAAQSANYSYFVSGDTVQRVDVATGKLEAVLTVPSGGALLAVDESQGIGCVIRNRNLVATSVAIDESARRAARYSNALERGSWEMRRGAKLESMDAPRAVGAFLSAVRDFGDAAAAAGEAREKAVVNLSLGRICDRLSVLTPADAESWRARAVREFAAAAALTCECAVQDVQELCRTATKALEGRAQP